MAFFLYEAGVQSQKPQLYVNLEENSPEISLSHINVQDDWQVEPQGSSNSYPPTHRLKYIYSLVNRFNTLFILSLDPRFQQSFEDF